jgi:Fic family protein
MSEQQPHWIWRQPDWPTFTWQDQRLAGLLREIYPLQGQLLGSVQGIASQESLQSEMEALLQNAMNTSAIEGERLDMDSVRSSLAQRLGLDRAGLPPGTPQTDGLADLLLDATHNYRDVLTVQRLHQWHRALFPVGQSGLTPIRVGELRGEAPMQVVSGPIGRPMVHFEAPPREGLEAELDAFMLWFNASRADTTLDPLLRAGIAHLWFVTLHPFDDGNGRIARVITDLALAQAEHHSVRFYAMATTIMAHREAYYRVLERTQRNGLDLTDWLEWFLIMLRQTLNHALDRIQQVLLKARFWQQHRQVILNERQNKVINRLLDAGVGGFEGGMNARKYRGLTQASKATATRDLTDLLEKGLLKKCSGAGRSTRYEIAWPT